MLTNVLDVPDALVGKIPCQDPETSGLFLTLDLDLDLDDPDYLALTQAEQQARHAAKEVAEQAAVAACQACPMLAQCRDWAMTAQVHGVAGGLTDTQRRKGYGIPAASLERGQRNAVPREWVHAWTQEGHTAESIADRLNCSVRTVERVRRGAGSAEALQRHSLARHTPVAPDLKVLTARGRKPEPAPAKAALDFSALTPESLAMYEFLASQDEPVDRRDVVQHVARFVAPETARKWGQALPCAEDKRETQGALKFARNRIDIAYRHGRVVRTVQGKATTLALPQDLKAAFREWSRSRVAVSA